MGAIRKRPDIAKGGDEHNDSAIIVMAFKSYADCLVTSVHRKWHMETIGGTV